ncbi:BTB/POZ protein, partial [Glomus cerebriforme]
MASEFFPGLSQNFSQLLEDADDYNVKVNVGKNPNTKEFCAHTNILRARSPYFKRALSQDWAEKKNNMVNFTKPNISPIVFEMIIKYMYTGILDLRKQAGADILDLLVASDELLIEELITFVQKYLIENHTEWLRNNLVNVLHTVFQLESCKQLQDYCLESI